MSASSAATRARKIVLVTRSYPSAENLYQYPFVHRRVLAYMAHGLEVSVFRPTDDTRPTSYSYEGVTCVSGNEEALAELVREVDPHAIAVHGFAENFWSFLAPLASEKPIYAWLHGSEIPEFFRQKANNLTDPAKREAAEAELTNRIDFWRDLLADWPPMMKLVMVSKTSVDMAEVDWSPLLFPQFYKVIPNPIDTDLFAYEPKQAEARKHILSIRPFDNYSYGNDMTVEAIVLLSQRPFFKELRFTLIGDGPMFDDVLAPLRNMDNVSIERRFMTQDEISAMHRDHGVFLVPTRLDTQGVSRDEAMSAGLVPVTNKIPAVLEFVRETEAGLAMPDDAEGLASQIEAMHLDPKLFLSRSKAAAARIRADRSNDLLIPAEIDLMMTPQK